MDEEFFLQGAEKVAQALLGKILVRAVGGRILKAMIVETEAYLGEDDPASWARYGKRKDNFAMWEKGGTVLIKNVHKYKMLNFVTGNEGSPEAVLIRAVEPLNFDARCCGPGLLTESLEIGKELNGKNLFLEEGLFIEEGKNNFEIVSSFRVGVVGDLKRKMRFYIKGNGCVSRK